MQPRIRIAAVLLVSLLFVVAVSSWQGVSAAGHKPEVQATTQWNPTAAARYLDSREVWWQSWPKSQRDHETVCVSCHTVVPYALARPLLRQQLDDPDFAAPEQIMYNYVVKRVNLWDQVEPFYKDNPKGPTKSIESRSTESVLNALILASYDARRGQLSPVTKLAFQHAWALQVHSGKNAGAWIWLNFHNGPWESDISGYWGATLAALATGIAPDHYRDTPAIQGNLKELRAYLRRDYAAQPLLNQIVLLWTSSKIPGLITGSERSDLIQAIAAKQESDGGWSTTDLGTWDRHDHTALVTKSDGYATGLIVLALEQNGKGRLPMVRRGREWLLQNQSSADGDWPAWSLNRHLDPATGPGHFMDDAATGYAVLALDEARK